MINILDREFKYPTLCISIVDNYLVFTTKKTGSRYFEDISFDKINLNQRNSINITIHNNEYRNNDNLEYNFFNYNFEVYNSDKLIDINQFLKILNADNFGDIFSDKVIENFNYVFITRNPLDRLFTGFFEKVDSIVGGLQLDYHGLFIYDIIKKQLGIDDYNSLHNLSQDKINLILNEFALSINYRLLNDEHLSLWNYFLIQFLHETNLYNKVQIIDLNDSSKMSIFNKIDQPSNKPWLSKWLSDENNKHYIDTMLLNLKPYMDLEIQSYNKLLSK
jgi:hypothetical protein